MKNDAGEVGFEVWVGGGLGRTPMIGKKIRGFVAKADLLAYLEAVLRVYNMLGRRDNMYKARVKILVHETGTEEFTRLVEKEFKAGRSTCRPKKSSGLLIISSHRPMRRCRTTRRP